MLQVFLVNAHYLYMEQAATRPELKKMTLLQFREKIIEALVGEDKRETKKKAEKKSMPQCGFHYLTSHPPTEKTPKPCKDCINCAQLGRKRKQTRYFCSLCPTKPTLCIEPCFQEWHSQLWRDEEATVNTSSSDSDSDWTSCSFNSWGDWISSRGSASPGGILCILTGAPGGILVSSRELVELVVVVFWWFFPQRTSA